MVNLKITLVLPSMQKKFIYDEDSINESLGLAYLASIIPSNWDMQIIDGFTNHTNNQTIIDMILDFSPNVLGISFIFDAMKNEGAYILKSIKEKMPNITSIAGGPYATLNNKGFLEQDLFDYIVLGEAEATLPELLKLFESNIEPCESDINVIDGLCYKNSRGEFIFTKAREQIKDIDLIPFPNRLAVKSNYSKPAKQISMISSRGCGMSCFYCSTDKMWKSKWRGRSAKNIVDEILYLKTQNILDDNTHIIFVDDNFTMNRKRVSEFYDEIVDNNIKNTWSCSSRAEKLDNSLLEEMCYAGCRRIFIGVESGSNKILNMLNRKYTKEFILELDDKCLSLGIMLKASFMVGLPYESVEDILETLDLINRMKTYNCAVHIFTPRIGTPSYENPEKYKIKIHENDTSQYAEDLRGVVSTSELSYEEINEWYLKIVGEIYRKAYIKDIYTKLINENLERSLKR